MNTLNEKFIVIDTLVMAAAAVWFISIMLTAMV
jgi:hypothetical protein